MANLQCWVGKKVNSLFLAQGRTPQICAVMFSGTPHNEGEITSLAKRKISFPSIKRGVDQNTQYTYKICAVNNENREGDFDPVIIG
jgi:hypothetical protein